MPDASPPEPDLVALWEEHTRYEFETRDVDATMATTARPSPASTTCRPWRAASATTT